MYPLLACSVLALAVILERGVFFFRTRQNTAAFLQAVCTGEGGIGSLNEKLRAQNPRGCLARMSRVYLDCKDLEERVMEEEIFLAGSALVREAEKGLSVLAAIGSLAPVMGLFGTVLGMIDVFRRLEAIGGRADVAMLSGGIWVALLTTAAGLLAAIPAIIACKYFSALAAGRSDDLQFLVSRLRASLNANGTREKTSGKVGTGD